MVEKYWNGQNHKIEVMQESPLLNFKLAQLNFLGYVTNFAVSGIEECNPWKVVFHESTLLTTSSWQPSLSVQLSGVVYYRGNAGPRQGTNVPYFEKASVSAQPLQVGKLGKIGPSVIESLFNYILENRDKIYFLPVHSYWRVSGYHQYYFPASKFHFIAFFSFLPGKAAESHIFCLH